MDGFGIFLVCIVYSLIAAIFSEFLEEETNILGRAFIWPIIVLIAMVKAIRSVYLETKAEMKDYANTINKK